MIAGIFLRHFKTYQNINFIPISYGDDFCGLLGNNGVGKSSVLEAIDCFFNNKTWNYNAIARRQKKTEIPHIVPIFLIDKNDLPSNIEVVLIQIDKLVRELGKDINKPNYKFLFGGAKDIVRNNFLMFIKKLSNAESNRFIVPIGIDDEGNLDFSILDSYIKKEVKQTINYDLEKNSEKLISFIKDKYNYIYIPKEIDPELFTQLETREMQVLMGESLKSVLGNIIPKNIIVDINNQLKKFITDIDNSLGYYAYRTLTSRQQNLRKNDIYDLIVDNFFNIRKLHKFDENHQYIEISLLSSGEKQKAIIDVACGLLKKIVIMKRR